MKRRMNYILSILAFSTLLPISAGCANSCEELAKTLCENHRKGKEKCSEWKEVASTMKEESCAESLNAMEELDR